MKENVEEVNQWLRLAVQDYQSAQFLIQMSPCPVEVVCYLCEQSVEKLLKGYLEAKGEPLKKTHDLLLLCTMCESYDSEFITIRPSCEILLPYGVNVRYPSEMDIYEEDMQEALTEAGSVKDFISEKIDQMYLEKEDKSKKRGMHI